MPKHETRNTAGSIRSLVNKFSQFINIIKENLLKNYLKNVTWKLVSGPFQFLRNPL